MGEMGKAYRILVGKSEGKRKRGRHGYTWLRLGPSGGVL